MLMNVFTSVYPREEQGSETRNGKRRERSGDWAGVLVAYVGRLTVSRVRTNFNLMRATNSDTDQELEVDEVGDFGTSTALHAGAPNLASCNTAATAEA